MASGTDFGQVVSWSLTESSAKSSTESSGGNSCSTLNSNCVSIA